MAFKHFNLTDEEKSMVLNVMKHVRVQEYTPEKLCELQKILDTQYYYWWINDMKKEEYGVDLYDENFECYCSGFGEYKSTPLATSRGGKWANQFMNTAHMGHQPIVSLIDDTHARGIFFFESNMTFLDNPDKLLEQFYIYCNDFVKHDNGKWYISGYRLIATKQNGELPPENVTPPEGYVFPDWEEI